LYADPVKRVIQRMKFDGLFALARPLADLMAEAWPKWRHPFDLVAPIPLHPDRLRQRGFNQSELLVEALANRLDWPAEPAAVKRSRSTRPQIDLSARERWENVRGAFTADRDLVIGRRILLVDDVSTSGATLAAAAEALLDAGATSVSAYCVSMATGNMSRANELVSNHS
jgi:ComF family protein